MGDSITRSRRRGSALLIVMGMFAFMIVSAVSFSVYMRSSRTPSSYARRNAFGRQIVRAALARAMDEVDTAVGNDPFPGFGKNHIDSKNFGNVLDTHNDDWVGRVFTPSNECSFSSTVPTLTLEGLGYLPPAIINEVRYGSRHTRTAQWRSFSYGLGRYAYTAVNVSDFLDLSEFEDGVNMNRSSAANSRVTPAYLFSKAAKTQNDSDRFNDIDSGDLSKFCAAMDPKQLNDVPLVSMLDYNLWFGKNASALLEYPFYRSISGGYSDSATFAYQDKQRVMPQLFIAGGWNGKEADASSGGTTLDTQIALENPLQQPFYGWSDFPKKMNLDAVFNDEMWRNSQRAVNIDHSSGSSRNVPQKLGEVLPAITQCLLYDYLDYDSTPLSLALPCTEETPMLVYVNLDNCVKWQTVVDEVARTEPATDTMPEKKFVKKTYKLQLKIEGMVNLGTVYPFLNNPRSGKSYSMDCFMRVFLTEGTGNVWANGLRDTGGGLKLETGDVGSGDFKWGSINDKVRQPAYLQVKSGRVHATSVINEDAAANAVNLADPLAFDWTQDIVLAEIEYEVDDQGNLKAPVEGAAKSGKDLGSEFSVLANDWAVTSVTDSANPFDETQGITGTTKYYPSAAVWVRIGVEGEDETVDLVPATLSYDNLDGKRAVSSDDMLRIASGSRPGTGTPLLRFFPNQGADSEIEFNGKFFVDNKGQEKTVTWDYPTYSANDPRYNWAPEDWCANSATDPKADGWLTKVQDFQKANKEWCDTDIFMQVSNQGYLQSMYELMMVPQVSPIGSFGTMDIFLGRFLERSSVRTYDGIRRTALSGAVNNELMWRTYKSDAFLFDTERYSATGYKSSTLWREWGTIEDLSFVESATGMRVNPYTDITNLFAGAIANMPSSWWSAGTNWNDTTGLKNYMDPSGSEAKRLNENYLLAGTIRYEDVADVSRFMMKEFRHDPTDANIVNTNSWLGWSKVMDVWNWLMPDGERFDRWNFSGPDNDADSLMADYTSVERKFMYGYLKGCFANTKQLFLMFVRAEPSDGGGGGRAVALVWRDPNSQFSDDNSDLYLQRDDPIFAEETWRLKNRKVPPHKMRVLFYHQFD